MQPFVVRILVAGSAVERVPWCRDSLARLGWQAMFAEPPTPGELVEEIRSGNHDVAIAGGLVPRETDEILNSLQGEASGCPVIILANGTEADLVDCLERGAWDCPGEHETGRLLAAIRNALVHSLGERRNRVVQSRLVERENSLRAITSHIPGMVFRLWVTHEEARFIYVSEGAESLLHSPRQEVVGSRDLFFSAVFHEDRASLGAALEQCHSGLSFLDWTGRLDVEGETTWINLRGSVARRDHRTEIDGVAIDVTASMEAKQERLSTMLELETLTRRLQEVREEERQRITHEIHDELGSLLTAVKMELFSLGRWVQRRVKDESVLGHLASTLDGTGARLNDALETVRRIARELRPRILDDFGVAVAMEWYVSEFARSAGLDARVDIDPNVPSLDDQLETAVFRIAQEGLTNVARHAQARQVIFQLRREPDGLEFVIEDDGIGLDEDVLTCPDSTGLVGMRERVRRLGGAMNVTRAGAKGTRLRFTFPLPTE